MIYVSLAFAIAAVICGAAACWKRTGGMFFHFLVYASLICSATAITLLLLPYL